MDYILFDGNVRNQLLPFTFTRPVADIRVGITTLREKWEMHLDATTSTHTEAYLSKKYPMAQTEAAIFVSASVIPSENLTYLIKGLTSQQALFLEDQPLAFHSTQGFDVDFNTYEVIQYTHDDLLQIAHTWDIFAKNHEVIDYDFKLLTNGRTSQPVPEMAVAFNEDQIFIEEGAKLPLCSLNASEGPIYIGKNAEIMEGAMIRGPFALCEGATIKMNAKIYTGCTIGPHSKVGGELNNSVIMGYSNKGHDGFLGNSVIGEWCNLGADTNNSNLKNNYAEVRLWDYDTERFANTGLQFCGLMMGDHSKCGINTMFNTGTVVGVSANIFGSGFPRNFIPSFSWGGSGGMTTYKTQKAFEVAEIVMARRNVDFTPEDAEILETVFEISGQWRRA